MERLVKSHPQAEGLTLRALKQAAREMLLAQASDWAFTLNRGAMTEYATQRTKTHLLRLNRLMSEIEAGEVNEEGLSMIESQDNIFSEIDYRSFC